jgi:hypothetical protein
MPDLRLTPSNFHRALSSFRCIVGQNGRTSCANSSCSHSRQMLRRHDIDEIVHLDAESQLNSIVRQNFAFLNKPEHYPYADVCNGEYYRNRTIKENQLTLIVHCDGAPLVRSSKQSIWPLFASLVELPPPIREHQRNIVLLALWASKRKPEPNIFLNETINDFQRLMADGLTLFMHGTEYKVHLSTQYFISDLPAKALFLRTINFNGYSACTTCTMKGSS